MKLLFTHSYFLNFDAKQLKTAMPYPPLGTLYALAYLKNHGFDVKLFDTQFCLDANEINATIDNYKPDVLVIYDDGFNYLTKMCLTNMRQAAFKMQSYAKKKGCKIIVSSSDATDHANEYLQNNADIVIIGEAEQTLLEICEAFKNKKLLQHIDGIVYLNENNKLIRTKNRIVLKDLDQLPPPAWDLLDINPYKKMWQNKHGYFALNFVTTRGCPYKCNWCAKPIYGNRYNSHSAEKIVLQIKQLQGQFGFTHVWFADDIFGLKPNWLKEFNKHIQQQNIKIKYKIQSRADLLLEDENIKYLSESGCEKVWIGAESGSQKILDAMDKGITVQQIYEATSLLKKNKIKVALFLQFGYLGETIEDINKTIDMVKTIMPDEIGASVSYPLPGTKFYEKVKEQLIVKSNWTDSDDLDLMFKNTYSKDFYKVLHRYVHKNYRTQLSIQSFKKLKTFRVSSSDIYNIASIAYYYPSLVLTKNKLKKLDPDASRGL